LVDFGEWQPCLRAVLEASSGLFRWALYGRPPLAKWCDGPVTMLGDAAHPMLPSMAQGAVMALEDAVV
ncbi:FAD-dependent monooxygenase, partial [uncultured Algibacter sp.]|uniref:FAD-dependent monooxygenase n=1 Tax=uncultured Algibacter sp. TaxID=298659 RepID=UPI00262E00D2